MPGTTIHGRASAGSSDRDAITAFVRHVTEASLQAESIPDDPELRMHSVVLYEERPPGGNFCGGIVADDSRPSC